MAKPRFRHVLPKITERQWQVAELVAHGYSNHAIAEELGITVAGAKYHVSELLRRLEVTQREEIASWHRSERVIRGQVIDPSNFDPEPIPAPLREQAGALGWPDDLLDRARESRVSVPDLARWLRYGASAELQRPRSAEEFDRWLRDRELLMFGTLRSRVASFGDNEALATLFAHSNEPAGGSDLTVERGPHAFAQFRLLDSSHVQMLEDRGIALAAVARGYPLVRVHGEEQRLEYQLAFVVREGARGHRYGRLISHVPRPANAYPAGNGAFYFLRLENPKAQTWLAAKGRTSATLAPSRPWGHSFPSRPKPTRSVARSGRRCPGSYLAAGGRKRDTQYQSSAIVGPSPRSAEPDGTALVPCRDHSSE